LGVPVRLLPRAAPVPLLPLLDGDLTRRKK
jgi:hypothetical protein